MSDEKRIGTTESVGELLRNKAPLPSAVPGLVAQQYSPEIDLSAKGWKMRDPTITVKHRVIGWTENADRYEELVTAIDGKIVIHADAIRRAFKVPSDTPIKVL